MVFRFRYRYGSTQETMVAITVSRELEEDLSEIEHFVGRIRWCKPDDLLDETYNMGIEIQELKDIHTETETP